MGNTHKKYIVFGQPLIEEAEIEEVVKSLRAAWLGTGPKVAAFEKLVAECIKNLDDPTFARRQRATEWLIRIGHPAKEPLYKALAAKPSLEMTARIETILRTLAPPAENGARRLRGSF